MKTHEGKRVASRGGIFLVAAVSILLSRPAPLSAYLIGNVEPIVLPPISTPWGVEVGETFSLGGTQTMATSGMAQFQKGLTFDVPDWVPVIGGNTYGMTQAVGFTSDSVDQYNYSLSMQLLGYEGVTSVAPGGTSRATPVLGLASGSLNTTHTATNVSNLNSWMDLPLDGMAPFSFDLLQGVNKLSASGSVPPFPGADPLSFSTDSTQWGPLGDDFNDGQATFNGVTVKLAGTETVTATSAFAADPAFDRFTTTTGTETMSGAYGATSSFDLLSWLGASPVPYVNVAAGALDTAGFDLNLDVGADLLRQDSFAVTNAYLDFDVPADAVAGSEIQFSGHLTYEVTAVTNYWLDLYLRLIFDHWGYDFPIVGNVDLISPRTLMNYDIGDWYMGQMSTTWTIETADVFWGTATVAEAGPPFFFEPLVFDMDRFLQVHSDSNDPTISTTGTISVTADSVPVPEPSMLLLLGSGLGGLAFARRLRSR